jgi:GNAT superfamily N-acetyltransferase
MESRCPFVRVATERDGPAIGEVHAASWLAAYARILDPEFLERAATGREQGWQFAMSRVLVPSNLVLVAGYEDRISGFSHSGPTDDGSDALEIFAFYCHPQSWGSGLADALMHETCGVLSTAAHRALLWTPREAHRARRFYERTGFRLTGRTRTEELNDWTRTPTRAIVSVVEYFRDLS